MISAIALVLVVTSAGADLVASTPGAASVPGALPAPTRLTIRTPGLLADVTRPNRRGFGWAQRLAQAAPAGNRPAATTPAQGAADGAAASPSVPAAEPDAPAPDPNAPSTDAAEDEPNVELLRHRARLTRVHRTLGITTWASMAVTTTLGTLLAINRPTWFGNGLCSTGQSHAIFGEFGCVDGLSALHEVSAFVTVGLYATTGIFALAMPDPEHAGSGNDKRGSTLRLHKAMAWIHLVGMILEPVLGVIAAAPSVIGTPENVRNDFSTALRTIHLGVGYVTFGALTTGMLLEL